MKSRIYLMLMMTVLLISCGKEELKTESDKIIPVKIVEVKKELVAVPIETSGIVSFSEELKLSFKTGGILEKLLVEEGEFVTKGSVIARLDLSEISAYVVQAKNAFEKAERDFNRVKNLYHENVATLEQFQNAETGFNISKSNLGIAEFNLSNSVIKAPSDGRILKKLAEEKELVSAGYPVILFGSQSISNLVKVGLTDKDIVKIRLGDKAEIIIDVYPGEIFKAIVTSVGELASPMNGTFEVQLKLLEQTKKLSSGFVAKVKIFQNQSEKLCIVPIESVIEADGDEAFVYYVNPADSTAKKQKIKIIQIFDGSVAIKCNDFELTHIITSGSEYLRNGAKVKVVSN
ncbi:MAG: efflux RND transporter periplasmic adaptor subunit [bacterium]